MVELEKLLGVEESDNDINILGKFIARAGGATLAVAGIVMEAVDIFSDYNLPGERVALGSAFMAGLGMTIDRLERWDNRKQ